MQQRLAAVGEMAAGIAHEIRNPLASMSGSIQILRQELPLTGEQAQLMDIVIRESDRLNETIRSFLAYARPQRQAAVAGRRARRSSPTPRRCCRTAPSGCRRTPSSSTCRAIRSAAWRTRRRSARSSGTSRRTPCARCRRRRAADDRRRLTTTARANAHLTIAVRDDGVGIAPARSRRDPAAVPRRLRARHRPRPLDRPPHRQRLRRRAAGQLAAGARDDCLGEAAACQLPAPASSLPRELAGETQIAGT